MSFDLAAHFGTMTRAVENTERDGKPAKAVIASRVYDTDAGDLWNALTTPARLKRWFTPISGDLELGGKYQFEGNAGGTITECVPEKRIAVTWEFAGGVSWVTVTLTSEGAGTRLQLQHVAHIDPHWEQFGPGAVGVGWDLGFMGLARHLADPASNFMQEEAANWHERPEAREFIRNASTDWGRAATAAGEPADEARAAAERTRQFYTGEMPPPAM
jgi:uncharacterized protein YndB with AHSA1/START domain